MTVFKAALYVDTVQDKHLVAAGQVYELGLDGTLDIVWADKSRSRVHPQEVYLIGDEVRHILLHLLHLLNLFTKKYLSNT